MTNSSQFDFEALLAPISEDNLTGIDFREDYSQTSNYSVVKTARKAARDAERNNMFDGDNTDAQENWRKIQSLAPKVLSEDTKDLEVACWYTEALVRSQGFSGLAQGFSLIRQLVEKFWNNGLYPVEDEDGIETRVAPIAGLNGEGTDGVLLSPMRSALITDDGHPGPFSMWQYQQAIDTKRIQDEEKRQQQEEKIGFTFDDIEKCVEQSLDGFYPALLADVQLALDEFTQVSNLLTEFCGSHDAPPSSKITELLEQTIAAIKHVAGHKLLDDTAQEQPDDEVSNTQPEQTAQQVVKTAVSQSIDTRDDAFKQLTLIAEYFKKHEPHSPISYIIKKAIKWGDMSLEELMHELIPDSSSRETYSSLTGVKTDD